MLIKCSYPTRFLLLEKVLDILLLEWSQDIHLFCSGIVPASEYLFSTPREFKKKVSF